MCDGFIENFIIFYQMVDDDLKRFEKVAAECAESSTEALQSAEKFLSALKESAGKSREGISLLDVKNREMLSYVAEVSFLMERMSAGQSIVDSPAVLRAARHRTVLERLRPIEDKMKSQIDKLTQLETPSKSKTSGLRARPDQMELDDDESANEDEDQGDGDEGYYGDDRQRKYVPPKMTAMHYQESKDDKGAKIKEKAKFKAMQSSLIQDLKSQYSEAPEEYREVTQQKYEIDKARQDYEEDHYVRLHVTRKDRLREEKMTRDTAMEDLLKFGNYMHRDDDKGGRKRSAGPPRHTVGPKIGRFEKKKITKAKKKHASKMMRKKM